MIGNYYLGKIQSTLANVQLRLGCKLLFHSMFSTFSKLLNIQQFMIFYFKSAEIGIFADFYLNRAKNAKNSDPKLCWMGVNNYENNKKKQKTKQYWIKYKDK